MVSTAWTSDTIKVAIRMNSDIGTLNSSRPFLMKYIWAVNAKIPPKLKTNENIRPVKDCWKTKTSPYNTKNIKGICIIRNPVMPPGNLNRFHSFQ
jgi:hypothetical protein